MTGTGQKMTGQSERHQDWWSTSSQPANDPSARGPSNTQLISTSFSSHGNTTCSFWAAAESPWRSSVVLCHRPPAVPSSPLQAASSGSTMPEVPGACSAQRQCVQLWVMHGTILPKRNTQPCYVPVQKASWAASGEGKPTQMEKTDLFCFFPCKPAYRDPYTWDAFNVWITGNR